MKKLLPNWFLNSDVKLQNKIKNDLFYYSMVKNNCSYEDLLASGWINTNYSIKNDTFNKKVFSTNINKNIINTNKDCYCILLSTGSYAPMHNGHIEMMLSAKDMLEKNGYIVDSILLSPSHDSYVLTKSNDIKDWTIENRIVEMDKIINLYPYEKEEEKELFGVDFWESTICNCPVNFTDVIKKIEKNIKLYLKKEVKIFYVFGSDNKDFANCFTSLKGAFKNKYFGVCIKRDGFPIKEYKNNIFYSKNNKFSNLKSRDKRRENLFKKDEKLINKNNFIYGVRLDTNYALKNWIESYPLKKEQLINDYIDFHNGLKNLIEINTEIKTITIDSNKQLEMILEVMDNNKNISYINADKYSFNKFKYNLDISRVFNINDYQKNPISFTIKNIVLPKGNYVFVDDDIVSGSTLNFVKNSLNKCIIIENKISLLDLFLKNTNINKKSYDIIDTRDFLTGSNNGGLMCKLNNAFRLPYFSPWVNLLTRANIPYDKQKQLMINTLKLLENFFKKNDYLSFKDINSDLSIFLRSNHDEDNLYLWHKKHRIWFEKSMKN